MPAMPHPIRIVLVEPQGPINIGAVCRAMKNFGLHDLALVKPACRIGMQARKMALHAVDILENARRTRTLGEAIADCALVLGTSNRGGPYHEPNMLPDIGARYIAEHVVRGPVAILFGREDFGLLQEDLTHCQGTIRIPTSPEFSSLNLAQAVSLVSYELYRHFSAESFLPPPPNDHPIFKPASNEEMMLLFKHMKTALLRCEFLMENNPDRTMQILRTVFGRAAINRRELKVLMGMFSNIRGYMELHPYDPKIKAQPRRQRTPAPRKRFRGPTPQKNDDTKK